MDGSELTDSTDVQLYFGGKLAKIETYEMLLKCGPKSFFLRNNTKKGFWEQIKFTFSRKILQKFTAIFGIVFLFILLIYTYKNTFWVGTFLLCILLISLFILMTCICPSVPGPLQSKISWLIPYGSFIGLISTFVIIAVEPLAEIPLILMLVSSNMSRPIEKFYPSLDIAQRYPLAQFHPRPIELDWEGISEFRCSHCWGSGEITIEHEEIRPGPESEKSYQPAYTTKHRCPTCLGTGKIRVQNKEINEQLIKENKKLNEEIKKKNAHLDWFNSKIDDINKQVPRYNELIRERNAEITSWNDMGYVHEIT
jgi:hypothetical protein